MGCLAETLKRYVNRQSSDLALQPDSTNCPASCSFVLYHGEPLVGKALVLACG